MLGFGPLSTSPLGAHSGGLAGGTVSFEGESEFLFEGRRVAVGEVFFEGDSEFSFVTAQQGQVEFEGDSEFLFGGEVRKAGVVAFEGDSEFAFIGSARQAGTVAFEGGSEFVIVPSPGAYERLLRRPNIRLVYAAEIELRRVGIY